MKNLISFKTMITPYLVFSIFWGGSIFMWLLGIMVFINIPSDRLSAVLMMICGPIILRVITETWIVTFRINNTLTQIERNTRKEK